MRDVTEGAREEGMLGREARDYAEYVTDVHGLEHLQAGRMVVAAHIQEAWDDLCGPRAHCGPLIGCQHMPADATLFPTQILQQDRAGFQILKSCTAAAQSLSC